MCRPGQSAPAPPPGIPSGKAEYIPGYSVYLIPAGFTRTTSLAKAHQTNVPLTALEEGQL